MKFSFTVAMSAMIIGLGACASGPSTQKSVAITVTPQEYLEGMPEVAGSNIASSITNCKRFPNGSIVQVSMTANQPGVSAVVPTMTAWLQGDENCVPRPDPNGNYVGLMDAQAHNTDIRQRLIEGGMSVATAGLPPLLYKLFRDDDCNNCRSAPIYVSSMSSSLLNFDETDETHVSVVTGGLPTCGTSECGSSPD